MFPPPGRPGARRSNLGIRGHPALYAAGNGQVAKECLHLSVLPEDSTVPASAEAHRATDRRLRPSCETHAVAYLAVAAMTPFTWIGIDAALRQAPPETRIGVPVR